MKIVILDTETTGTETEDRICQLSYLVADENGEVTQIHDALCTPPLPVKYDAMAVHHITPEMLEGTPPCIETDAYARLQELNTPENILVIHNAQFDLEMLAKEGFENRMQVLDTYRILRKAEPGKTGLQYKRYELGLYRLEEPFARQHKIQIRAHDALGDVVVLKFLLDHLRQKQNLEEMAATCAKPILLEIMPFGRHMGERIEEVATNSRNDLQYMLDTFDLDEDLRYSFGYWMEATKDRARIEVGFGKYKGKTPAEIAPIDPGYIRWLDEKATNISDELKSAIRDAAESLAR